MIDTIQNFEAYCNQVRNQWAHCPNNTLPLLEEITLIEKQKKAKQVNKITNQLLDHMRDFPDSVKKRRSWKNKSDKMIKKLLESDDLFKLENMAQEVRQGFLDTTKEFARRARAFDPELAIEGIGQAGRNVWIINMLQVLMGVTPQFSNALFGYSMLYPYTDNYLDDPLISTAEKKTLNERLYLRLIGKSISAQSTYEEKVFSLVTNIEHCYSREQYPQIYESLLSILAGQVNSLNQQNSTALLSSSQLLHISIEKGGASVLVDGYFIRGTLSLEEIYFCMGYGFFLQLADDLQDIKEDIKNNHQTIFSQQAGKIVLDKISNQLLHFIHILLDTFYHDQLQLKSLIKNDCILLVLFSIILNKEYFSQEYIDEIEKYLPFSIAFIENFKTDFSCRLQSIPFIKDREKTMLLVTSHLFLR